MAKKVKITGPVLKWAMDEVSLSEAELAEKLDVDSLIVHGWIQESDSPNKGQFDAIVKLLARPASFLFLPEPPSTPPRDVNFRTYAGSSNKKTPSQTTERIRLAERVQQVAAWI